MSFRMPREIRSFFKEIPIRGEEGLSFKTLFDQYYLCLMVGLLHGTLGERKDVEEMEFVDQYPQPYGQHAPAIAGLLIQAEMARNGILREDRASIQNKMVTLLDYKSTTLLSRQGHLLLDEYAAGGIAKISETIPKPRELPEFLALLHERVLSKAPSL